MLELNQKDRDSPDGLFLERLEAFMDKWLAEMRAFSERELRPFEETRRYVAEWHCKYLFQPLPPFGETSPTKDKSAQVRSILSDASRILESLHEVSKIHSFLLAVDPSDVTDQGFLGGTVLGREFWRGMRGGGCMGATAFKLHCIKAEEAANGEHGDSSRQSDVARVKRTPASTVKTALYANVRKALRSVSGVRNAEMKWTNHERLNVYGVRILGWPQNVPTQNPSTLSAAENKLILTSFENGTIKFVRTENAQLNETGTPQTIVDSGAHGLPLAPEDDMDFSWAYNDDPPSPTNVNSDPLHKEGSTHYAIGNDIPGEESHVHSFTTPTITDPFSAHFEFNSGFEDIAYSSHTSSIDKDNDPAPRHGKRPRSEET